MLFLALLLFYKYPFFSLDESFSSLDDEDDDGIHDSSPQLMLVRCWNEPHNGWRPVFGIGVFELRPGWAVVVSQGEEGGDTDGE